MADADIILLAQIGGLAQKLDRIKTLVNHPVIDEVYRKPIYGKFARAISKSNDKLNELRKRAGEAGRTEAQIAVDWKEYTSIMQESQRIFEQCLDYLGGIVVRKFQFDEGICNLAEELVKHFVDKAGANWYSVMIVGEERLFDEVAEITQIIRIRLPEWDICSLPFTAHEFGQLVASVGDPDMWKILTELFDKEEDKLHRLVEGDKLEIQDFLQPGYHSQDEAIKELRQRLKLDLVAESERDEEEQKKLETLISNDVAALRGEQTAGHISKETLERFYEQQRIHMRSLFADAFATYFMGPAYIYAHLFLRLIPTLALEAHFHKPSRARRYAFMLSTLQKMNDIGKPDKYTPGPFEGELSRFKNLWQITIQSTSPDHAKKLEFGVPYDHWFDEIFAEIRKNYSEGFNAVHWKKAEKLSEYLLDANMDDLISQLNEEKELKSDSPLPVIINAAWHCRVRHSDRTDSIEKVTRNLYQAMVSKKEPDQKPTL